MEVQTTKSWPKQHPIITVLLVLFVVFPAIGAISDFLATNLHGKPDSGMATSTHSPAKTLEIIDVSAVKVREDSIGIPEIAITIKNKSKRAVDAVDLKAEIFNNYDEPSGKTEGSIYTEVTVNNFMRGTVQEKILPGASYTAVFSLLNYPHASKAKNVQVTRLHFIDGETVKAE